MKRIRQARAWSAGRTATATAALALLAAACSSGSASTAGGSSATLSAVGYSACMRSHGVPKFPDPDSGGHIPKTGAQQLGVSSAQFQAAMTACRSLLPAADQPGPPSQAQLAQMWNATRSFASCMRSHGVSNWPDPISDSIHTDRPAFHLPAGLDQNSPPVTAGIRACEPTLHGWHASVDTGTGQTVLGAS
jgi:hypothetical protein